MDEVRRNIDQVLTVHSIQLLSGYEDN